MSNLVEDRRQLLTILSLEIADGTGDGLKGAIERIRDIIEEHKGTVNHVTKDGLLAVFGLDSSCEKHAVHACLAARQAHCAMASGLTIGIHTGEVILERNILLKEPFYRIAGDTTHIARKLAKTGQPGTTVISEDVRSLTATRFHSQFHRLYMLAGKEGYCCAYIQGKEKDIANRDSHGAPFEGREAELETLREGYRLSQQGKPQIFHLYGNPGHGKTRLIGEFVKGLQDEPVTPVIIEHFFLPRSSAQNDFFQHIFDAVRNCLCPGQLPLQAVRSLAEMLGARNTLTEQSLYCLAGLGSADQHWHNLEPTAAETITASALCGMIRQLSSRHPLLLILEDIHWAGAEARVFLHEHQKATADTRALLLLSSRDDQAPCSAASLNLPPLQEDAVRKILDEWLGDASSLSALKQKIYSLSEGNPLFIHEIITDLLNKGHLSGNHGAYLCTPDAIRASIPLTLQVLINAKIHALDEDGYRVLKCASVIGARFAAPMLASITHMGLEELAGHLCLLEKADFITRLDDESFQFRHALIQEETYRSILKPEKKLLHERLFKALSETRDVKSDTCIYLCAHHAYCAGLHKPGFAYNYRAAMRALDRARGDIAHDCLERAISCLEHLPDTARSRRRHFLCYWGIVQALSIQGRHDEAKIMVSVIEKTTGLLDNPDIHKKLCCLKLMTMWIAGNLFEGIEYGQRFLATLAIDKDENSFISTSIRIAGMLVDSGQYRQAIEILQPLENFYARKTTSSRYGLLMAASGATFAFLSRCHGELGDYTKAAEYAAISRTHAEKNGSHLSLIYSYSYGSAYLIRQKKYEEALPYMERAFALSREAHTDLLYPAVAAHLGFIYVNLSRREEGLALLREAREVALGQKAYGRQALYIQLLAEACLLTGDYNNALSYASEAIAIAEKYGEQANMARSCLIAARSHLMLDPASGKSAPFREKAQALAEKLGLIPLRHDIANLKAPPLYASA